MCCTCGSSFGSDQTSYPELGVIGHGKSVTYLAVTTPKNFGERVIRWIDRLTLVGDVFTICSQSIYFTWPLLTKYLPQPTIESIYEKDQSFRQLSPLIFFISPLKDLMEIWNGAYIVRDNDTINKSKTAARVCASVSKILMISHEIAHLGLLNQRESNLIHRIYPYTPYVIALGHLILFCANPAASSFRKACCHKKAASEHHAPEKKTYISVSNDGERIYHLTGIIFSMLQTDVLMNRLSRRFSSESVDKLLNPISSLIKIGMAFYRLNNAFPNIQEIKVNPKILNMSFLAEGSGQ